MQLNLELKCRDEIASCSERAYKQLSVSEAQKLMLFTSSQEAAQFAEQVLKCFILLLFRLVFCVCLTLDAVTMQRGWQVKGKIVYFEQQEQADLKDLPAVELMNHTLTYARELERIV